MMVFMQMLQLALEQALLYMPLILGSYVSISLMKLPDLALEASYVCGAIFGYRMLVALGGVSNSSSFLLVLGASIVGGILVGLCVGLLHYAVGIPHLLASIIIIGLFHGIAQLLLGGAHATIGAIPSLFALFAWPMSHPEFGILAIIAVLLVGALYAFFCTQLGYSFAIYGNNARFFSFYGISTGYVFLCGLLLAHGLAGLSGALVAQSMGMVDVSMGFGVVLLSLTSLVLGKAVVGERQLVTLLVPCLGTGSYFLLQQGLLYLASSTPLPFSMKYFTMFQSCIVLGVLIIKYYGLRRAGGTMRIDHLGV